MAIKMDLTLTRRGNIMNYEMHIKDFDMSQLTDVVIMRKKIDLIHEDAIMALVAKIKMLKIMGKIAEKRKNKIKSHNKVTESGKEGI